MHIERKFYTEAAKMWREIGQEEKARRENMSDAEKAAEKAEIERGFQALIQKCEQKNKETYRIISPEKIANFQSMAGKAMWLAEQAEMDVYIKTEGTVGKIKFVTDYFIINYNCLKTMRTIMGELILTADDVCIHAENSLMQMEFMFDLYIAV